MHPPLDRPHPDCQEAIAALQKCRANRPYWKIWACNDLKYQMDACFRQEKSRLLENLNKDMFEDRSKEEDAWKEATGQDISFEEYLKRDKSYQRTSRSTSSDNGNYQTRSTGAHA
jgi:COX assembly protein 2